MAIPAPSILLDAIRRNDVGLFTRAFSDPEVDPFVNDNEALILAAHFKRNEMIRCLLNDNIERKVSSRVDVNVWRGINPYLR